jgi:hypothetical protein
VHVKETEAGLTTKVDADGATKFIVTGITLVTEDAVARIRLNGTVLPAAPDVGHPLNVIVVGVEVAVPLVGVWVSHVWAADSELVNAMPPVTADVTETVCAVPGVYVLPLTVQVIVIGLPVTVRPESITVLTATPRSVAAVPVFEAAMKLNVPPTAVPSDAQFVVAPVMVKV